MRFDDTNPAKEKEDFQKVRPFKLQMRRLTICKFLMFSNFSIDKVIVIVYQ